MTSSDDVRFRVIIFSRVRRRGSLFSCDVVGLPARPTRIRMAPGDLPDAVVRRINLVEVLMDAHPACPEPPEEAPTLWSEDEIRAYFESEGRIAPAGASMAALDVNGEPLPPSTRPDGQYLCQRVGCSAVYSPSSNPEGCCRYHAVRRATRQV